MKLLITGDIHLDGNPDHEYRWRILKTLGQHLDRDDVGWLIIAGDLVDKKDRHSATFVNRVVIAIAELACHGPVIVLKGNHDYIDRACPFFQFLERVENVAYITNPLELQLGEGRVLFVPQGETWFPDPAWRTQFPLSGPRDGCRPWDLIVTHETFQGAMASTNVELDGVPLQCVSKDTTRGACVISGDIHVPQQLGNVLYCGAPHHVRFGDSFDPRILLWDFERGKAASIPMGGLRRVTAEYRLDESGQVTTDAGIREGDHVKVRFRGDHAAQLRWAELSVEIRGAVDGLNATHFGEEFILEEGDPLEIDGKEPDAVDDVEYFAQYCAAHEIDAVVAEGMAKWL